MGEKEMVVAGANDLSFEIFSRQLGAPLIPSAEYDWHKGREIFQLTPFFTVEEQLTVEDAPRAVSLAGGTRHLSTSPPRAIPRPTAWT